MVDCDNGETPTGRELPTTSDTLFEGRGKAWADGDGESVKFRTSSSTDGKIYDFGQPLLM
jgi:hypothetical protein